MELTFNILESPDSTEQNKRITIDLQDHDSVIIGRDYDVRLPVTGGGFISRQHLVVEVSGTRCVIRDLGSTNKTFVRRQNDRGEQWIASPPEQITPIYSGDYIRLGWQSESRTTMQISFVGVVQETLVERLIYCVKCSQPAPDEATKGYDPFICPLCRRHSAVEPDKPRLPQDITPDYETLQEVGRGAMGIVYQARRVTPGHSKVPPETIVALKTIIPQKSLSQRERDLFKRETAVCAALDHRYMVEFFERCGFQKEERLWFAMEFVAGSNAAKLAPFPLDEALQIADQILAAVDYAHYASISTVIQGRQVIQRGVVHRDIKPSNILITGQDSSLQAKLADFGLAKGFQLAGQSYFTATQEVGGTPAYMAPEQILNYREAKPAADIYSFGATLYTLLTGQLPYDFGKGDVFVHILNNPIVPLQKRSPAIPHHDLQRWDFVAQVIEKAMRKRPEERYTSAAEMRSDLATLKNSGEIIR